MNNAQKEYLRRAIQAQLNQRKEDKIEADKKAEVKRLKAEKDAEKNKIETRAKEFRRYEYLMGIDDISRAVDKLLKGDSTAYNKMRGIDQFRVDEAMSLIDKYSKKPSTPSTTTSGGTTGGSITSINTTGGGTSSGGISAGGGQSIVQQKVLDPNEIRKNNRSKNARNENSQMSRWKTIMFHSMDNNQVKENVRKAIAGEPVKVEINGVVVDAIWNGNNILKESSWEPVK